VMGGVLGLRRVEMLEEAGGEELAPLAEQQALFVAEGQDPGQLGADLASGPPVGPGDPARGEPGPAEGRPAGSIRGQQTLQDGPRESTMAARRGEDVQPPA
jgi:hypothetical protein